MRGACSCVGEGAVEGIRLQRDWRARPVGSATIAATSSLMHPDSGVASGKRAY